jgi:toxin ParE1/3/4
VSEAVTHRPRARLDLLDQYVYLDEQAGVAFAERYFTEVDETCRRLLRHPPSGVLYDSGIPKLKGIRRVPVSGFESYLIFYLATDCGIDVVRVLHGTRNIDNLFELEET